MRIPTIEELDKKIEELKTKHDNYIARYEHTLKKLQAIRSKHGTEKFKVGDPVFHKEHGNMIVKEVMFENNKFLYCCVGAHSGIMRFLDTQIEYISLGNQVLYRK